MDFVFWIIAIVLIVGVVWWLLNRNSSANTGGAAPRTESGRAEGGLAGGSAAASADAAGTAGLPSAAGFGRPAEPVPPTTADDEPELSDSARKEMADAGQQTVARPDAAVAPAAAGHRTDVQPEAAAEEGIPAETAATAGQSAAAWHEELSAHEPAAPADPLVPEHPVAAGPVPSHDAGAHIDSARSEPGATEEAAGRPAEDEWETQWSEASGSAPAASHRPAADVSSGSAGATEPYGEPTQDTGYVHHTEYTDPHSPTLPGAETAAAEAATAETSTSETATPDAFTRDYPAADGRGPAPTEIEPPEEAMAPPAEPMAAPSEPMAPTAEAIGHLAADQPYGAGSASPGPGGSGPADFVVKGDARAMVYYEEGRPDYEQTTADVWFESAAHAEAAGFRAPRRTRL
ncbi:MULTISPECIES: hypothetical protein [unclassified Arthrobacter]|uniref:sunset domain-containing protein n=1 Tax=unclassified Arthrobacter TaxID=235627 RepID=UPI0033913DB5